MSKSRSEEVTLFAPSVSPFFQRGKISYMGGAETQLNYIASMLVEAGMRVRVLTINVEEGRRTSPSGIEVVNTWSSNFPRVLKALRLFKEVAAAPSPIYLRAPSPVHALVVLLGLLLRKAIVVGLASDLNCVIRPGDRAGNAAKWIVLKLSTLVIAQTRSQQHLLKQNFNIDAPVFSNVIRRDQYAASRQVPFVERDVDVIWIGSIEPRKGLEQVCQYAKALPRLKFVVLGGPLPNSVEYHRDLLEKLRTLHNVNAPGFVEPRELPHWLGRSRVLLHTSRPVQGNLSKEGFPNVFLEAWASGLPVVSTWVDPDGLLASGGLGFRCNSTEEGVSKIQLLTGDGDEWISASRRCDDFVARRDVDNPAVREEFIRLLSRCAV